MPVLSDSQQLTNDPDRIHAIEEKLLTAAKQAGHDSSTAFALRLALDEALRNAFTHGATDPSSQPVDVSWTVESSRVTIVINDHGPGFDPDAIADPTADENIERPCGRGLLLMRAYMTSVSHNKSGNTVTMRYEPGGG